MLSGKRIILGITGGIAAYKAAFLLRAYQKQGAEVRVIMTPAAQKFVGSETFAALSKHEVAANIFSEGRASSNSWTKHIDWAEWADLFVIAPCTANTLGKIAHGLSDNMLTATVLAARCPLLISPTMDGEMYQSSAVRENLKKVKKYGYHLLEPDEGYLASGLDGKGRLPESSTILEKSISLLPQSEGLLTGKKVTVTAGPTREHIDPVRFISNPSSGKMGFAMAEAAQHQGADVTLIHGPVAIEKPYGIKAAIKISSADQLFEAVKKHADADVVIMAAAVSDLTPDQTYDHKVKKDHASSSISLKKTTDILAWLGVHKKDGQMLIGFAMETEDLIKNARKKLQKKNLDWMVANSLSKKNSGFGSDSNSVHLLSKDVDQEFSGPKKEIARELLDAIFNRQNIRD